MKPLLYIIALLIAAMQASAQSLFVAGPMPGYTELRTARIWTEVKPSVDNLSITWWKKDDEHTAKTMAYDDMLRNDFGTAVFTLTALGPGTTYSYEITASQGRKTEKQSGDITTQQLWHWRRPAPDFSFLAGSCSFINQPVYDRPKPYGGDSSIFLTMAHTPADFMLWLGDNWYTREADYFSAWGLRYRAHHDRSIPVLQPLLKAMPHYAIWDDHDYGPNDFSASYNLKKESRSVFRDYWANPTCGMNGEGVYTQFMYNDVAFFLLDDRTWRSNDGFKDSVNGKPDSEKTMFGKEQMQWLKDALLSNRYATFKIIASGSQMLNPATPWDCFTHFEAEYRELMDFLKEYKITGVLFMTGDRHHSEIIKIDRPGLYPLYDITVSPLTSRTYSPDGAEKDMPQRVPNTLVTEQNYGKITVSGGKGERTLSIRFLDIKGNEKARWQITEKELGSMQ